VVPLDRPICQQSLFTFQYRTGHIITPCGQNSVFLLLTWRYKHYYLSFKELISVTAINPEQQINSQRERGESKPTGKTEPRRHWRQTRLPSRQRTFLPKLSPSKFRIHSSTSPIPAILALPINQVLHQSKARL
jgi:hypothetical protein